MTTEIKNLKSDLLQIRNEWNTVNADNKEIKLLIVQSLSNL